MLGDIIEIIAPDGAAMRVPLAGGDEGVADTIEAMVKIVIDADRRLITPTTALNIRAGRRSKVRATKALFSWMQLHVEFCKDPKKVERIQHPERILEQIRLTGRACVDCDESATLAAALLLGMGIEPVFITVSESEGGNFSHVYAGVQVSDGRVIAFDPQETAAVGEEAPHKRRKVWPI